MKSKISALSLYFAWLLSLAASIGSIYFGEFLDHEPCVLCWYQRICMFPMVFFLGVAAFKEDKKIWQYVIYPLVIGSLVALYQLFQGKISWMLGGSLCGSSDCVKTAYNLWKIPFPLLSFLAFIGIIVLVIIAARKDQTEA